MHNEKSQYIFSTEKFFCARFKTIQFLNIRTLPSLPYVSFQYSSYEMIFSPAWFGGSHAKETLVAPFSNIRKLVGWPGTPCWVFTYNYKNYSVFSTDGILQNRFTVSFYNPQFWHYDSYLHRDWWWPRANCSICFNSNGIDSVRCKVRDRCKSITIPKLRLPLWQRKVRIGCVVYLIALNWM